MRLPHPSRFLVCCLVAAAASTLPLTAGSRRLSDVERSAVQEAVAYLNSGPAPLVEHLASTSPLRKLSANDAQQEIEVRLGPNSGATWELQTVVGALQAKTAAFTISYPSGIDETALIDLVEENGAIRIQDIRVLALPSSRQPIFPPVPHEEQRPATPERSSAALIVALVAAIFAAAGVSLRKAHAAATAGIAAGAVLGVVSVVLLLRDGALIKRVVAAAAQSPVAAKPADAYPRLAPLLPLRRAMTLGNVDALTLPAVPCREKTCADVAALWRAQLDLQQMRTDDAKAALAKFESPSDVPLAEMLRGRIAVLEADDTACVIAYENAINLGPGRDALWCEAAQALGSLGFDDRAETYFRKTTRIGSRSADPYYVLSLLSALHGKENDAEEFLDSAWSLQPVERADLVRFSVLNPILQRGTKQNGVGLADPAEAALTAPEKSTRAIALPDGARAETNGDQLRVFMGQQRLIVAGGAALAPAGTPAIDAVALAAEDEQRALEDYAQLAQVSRAPGVYTNPALRLRILNTAGALANRNRWADLASLTDGLSPRSEHVPAELFFLRGIALERQQKLEDARQMLKELAASKTFLRKRDARAFRELGEMLASLDVYDLAVKMLDRAEAIRPNEFTDIRVRQISMNKRLATKYNTYSTLHFEIHYPEDVSRPAAEEIGRVFEAELTRLQQWVHVPVFQPVVVNIVWWEEFRSTMTGSDFILGIYTGKITVPLAGIRIYVPEIVDILSHELCHAMIAQATNDQAPHWFQEGLAQLIEMKPYVENAFNAFDPKRVIALSLLDPVLTDAGEPSMMLQAYSQAQTTMKYVEKKYGKQGIATLLAAFRDGATTEEAIQKLSGRSLAKFDEEVRAWGTHAGAAFDNPPPVRYDETPGEGVHWSKPRAGSNS